MCASVEVIFGGYSSFTMRSNSPSISTFPYPAAVKASVSGDELVQLIVVAVVVIRAQHQHKFNLVILCITSQRQLLRHCHEWRGDDFDITYYFIIIYWRSSREIVCAVIKRCYTSSKQKDDAISWAPNAYRVSLASMAVNWWPMAMHLDVVCVARTFHWSITLAQHGMASVTFCQRDNLRAFMFSLPFFSFAISSENKSSECATFAKYEHLNVENGTLSFYCKFCVDVW